MFLNVECQFDYLECKQNEYIHMCSRLVSFHCRKIFVEQETMMTNENV
jgi:hypothetical protein